MILKGPTATPRARARHPRDWQRADIPRFYIPPPPPPLPHPQPPPPPPRRSTVFPEPLFFYFFFLPLTVRDARARVRVCEEMEDGKAPGKRLGGLYAGGTAASVRASPATYTATSAPSYGGERKRPKEGRESARARDRQGASCGGGPHFIEVSVANAGIASSS